MSPPAAAGPSAADVERERAAAFGLTGVFLFPRDRSAVIDGSVVRVGDGYEGFAVIAIESRSVTLRGAHGDYDLSMSNGLIPPGVRDDKEER